MEASTPPNEKRRGVRSSPGLSAGRPGSARHFSTLNRHRRPPSHPRPYLPDPRVVAVRARSQPGGGPGGPHRRHPDPRHVSGDFTVWLTATVETVIRTTMVSRLFQGGARHPRHGDGQHSLAAGAFHRCPHARRPPRTTLTRRPSKCLGGQRANTPLWIFSARHRNSSRFSQDSLRGRRFS
jgi:hypothetical protein